MTSGAPGRGPRGGAGGVLLVAAVAGAGTMSVELAAVRLLAPWFGTSLSVWTNVIGVILLALALGYLFGARLSARGSALGRLALVLLGAALAAAVLPALARPVCELFLPRDVALQEAAELVRWGSLAAALTLFLPAPALLGMVGPLAVEAVQRRTGSHAGTAGGQVLAVSTLGSLAGTFGTTHLFLPELGLRTTFALVGGALALAAVAAWLLARREGAAPHASALALLAALPAAALLPEPAPALPAGARLLASAESAYQLVRIVELAAPDGAEGAPLRHLQVNEGFDSFQSVWAPEPGLLPEGYYYDDFVLPVWWDAAEASLRTGAEEDRGARGEPPRAWRVLVLGLGGGTTLRVLDGALPPGYELHATGIELDPVVVALGREYMDAGEVRGARLIAGLDARAGARLAGGPFDQVVVDTYANQVEIPPHLSTVEFFAELSAVLAPRGWVSVNVGGFGFDDPVVRAVGSAMAAGLATPVLVLRVPQARNYVLFARPGAELVLPGSEPWRAVGEPVQGTLLAKRTLPGSWTVREPGDAAPDELLTDDRNPVELLQTRSIAEGRARMHAGRREEPAER